MSSLLFNDSFFDPSDICQKYICFPVKYEGDMIKWSIKEEFNNVNAIINVVNCDYDDLIEKANCALFLYLSDNKKDVESIILCFHELLSNIHPFFTTVLTNPIANTDITPACLMFFYNLVFNINGYIINRKYKKNFGNVDPKDLLHDKIFPVAEYIDKKNANILTNNFLSIDNFGTNKIDASYDLCTLKDAINVFKKVLTIYSNTDIKERLPYKDDFLKLFLSHINPYIQKHVDAMNHSYKQNISRLSFETLLELDEDADIFDYISKLKEDQHMYAVCSFYQLMYLYLRLIVENNMKIKKCKRCGKLFVAQNNNEVYCQNITEDGINTCRDIGAQETSKTAIANDPVLKLKRKIQKRFSKNRSTTETEYNKSLINAVKEEYYKYQDKVWSKYKESTISSEEACKLIEQMYKETKNYIKEQTKETAINTEETELSKEDDCRLKRSICRILDKYI